MKTEIQGGRRSLELFHAGVVRPVMLVLLVFLLWGTLLAAAFVWRSLTLGLAAAVATQIPARGDLWGWVNLLTALGAVIAWLFVAATVLGSPRKPRSS
jgi:hypothetical protein